MEWSREARRASWWMLRLSWMAVGVAIGVLGCEHSPFDTSPDDTAPSGFFGPVPRWMAWSPLGTEIVYEQNGQLLVGRGEDLKDARAITGRGDYRHPSWSPDGRYLAYDYASVAWRGSDIWVRPADKSEIPRRVTETAAVDFIPSWSTDGRWIAFHSRRSPGSHVWVVPAEGGSPVPLGPALAREWSLNWSPDGATLAYERQSDSDRDIWAADPVTRSVWRLAGTPGGDSHPVWRPDGEAIGFISTRGGSANVWVQELEADSEPQQLTTLGGVARFAWIADGGLMFVTGDRRLYAQAPDPESTPTFVRDAVDFAVSPTGPRYAYVVAVENYYRYYAADVPPDYQ